MNKAQNMMNAANKNALIGSDGGIEVMIEDVADLDGRIYRIEYHSTPDGLHSISFCRYNPWGGVNGGMEYRVGHVDSSGFICVGEQSVKTVQDSPYDLSMVIVRSRYWCTAFSVLKETGKFPTP